MDGQMRGGKMEGGRKDMAAGGERGGGGAEIYQETRVIFNDPCTWRGKTTPARSPPPNTDPLT